MPSKQIQIIGLGLQVPATETHPAGTMFSGGYDAVANVLYLASVIGHPRGMALAGGDPSSEHVAGLRILIVASGAVYWTTDSMSLPRGLKRDEAAAVQLMLEQHFSGQMVIRVDCLEAIPK
ncbi:MAG TPA: hypothetical protein VGJ15_07365 [Pirellulales bacterium]|jgi:hypothetical protein